MRKIFWGLFFMVAGAFVLLDQFYNYTNLTLLNLLLTIFIVAGLIKSIYRVSFPGILFSLAFLGIIYSEPLQLENITPIPILLAALFGSIGLSILFNKHCFHKRYQFNKHNCEHFSEVINDEDGEEVSFSVSFGSSIKYINSENLKKANLRCSFGDMKVYFDKTKVEDNAIISLDVSFAGVELYIPKEWKVINKVDVTLGALEPKNESQPKFDKTIILKGKLSLGAIDIIYI